MSDLNNKIDKHIKDERHKSVIYIAIVLALTVPLLWWLATPPMGKVTQITGVVERLTGVPTDEGEKIYLLVKLDNGKLVRALISNSAFSKKGKIVKLDKMEPLFFGRTIYRYRGYVN